MATRKTPRRTGPRVTTEQVAGGASAGTSLEELMLAAQERGGDSLETGRYLMTFKEGGLDEGVKSMGAAKLRMADARDFDQQAVSMEALGDADGVLYPEVGVALLSGNAMATRAAGMAASSGTSDSSVATIEPEYFVFSDGVDPGAYLRGFMRAAETIARDLGDARTPVDEQDDEGADAQVLGRTWGLAACKVPASTRTGLGIRVAVLDTGLDLGHPDFAGRAIVGQTFVGQPVQDMHSHGTHCTGTACGPLAPAGSTPRYGVAHRAQIFIGKVLSNSGFSVGNSVIAGMNWAIANNCHVISMSLGGQSPVQAAYTAAGQAALTRGLLIVAAAGNSGPGPTQAPANSPTIMAVASLDMNLAPSSFSCRGKIQIAGPGRDVFSSVPRPTRYGTKSGTSMATPHVAGCAALWAQTSPALRGMALWNRLLASARPLPFPATQVGRGLVQAPG
jgi:subtilisin family serine protease